jgi:DNA-binding transcriptional MerR regulator
MAEPEKVVRAFSADHVSRLTGLSSRQLRYWDKTGFFSPQYVTDGPRGAFSRIYSFRDVVGLKTLAILRNNHHITLQYLRKAAQELSQHSHAPWAETVLYVWGKDVLFHEPDTRQLREVVNKQYVIIPLQGVAHDVETDARKLTERTADQIGAISRKRYIAHNAWVIAGTRIPTKAIWRFHEAGYTPDQIVREYPTLTPRDIDVAVKHEEKLARTA